MWDPATSAVQVDAAQAVAKSRGVALEVVKVDTPSAIEPGFETAASLKVQAVLVLTSPLFGTLPRQVADAALRRQLPAITMFPEFAEVGVDRLQTEGGWLGEWNKQHRQPTCRSSSPAHPARRQREDHGGCGRRFLMICCGLIR
jgi:hypothetical protein